MEIHGTTIRAIPRTKIGFFLSAVMSGSYPAGGFQPRRSTRRTAGRSTSGREKRADKKQPLLPGARRSPSVYFLCYVCVHRKKTPNTVRNWFFYYVRFLFFVFFRSLNRRSPINAEAKPTTGLCQFYLYVNIY